MTKYQWLSVASAALQNAGLSPSSVAEALGHVGVEIQDAEPTKIPTNKDWYDAYNTGGNCLSPEEMPPLG